MIQEKLDSLPQRPGCYVFKDAAGQVLYVGKATSLRSRVRSYFQDSSSDNRSFLPLLRRNVADLETIVTASEKEATILEHSLIKQLKPRYNVKLRDDKSYLSLRLDMQHAWPRLELVRRPQPDGARYFGPHHSAVAARRTLSFINKHFQLRTCTDQDLVTRKRPCLQFHIKRCPGPCVFEIERDAYMANVQAVALFLDGRHDEVLKQVEARMKEASARMDFEQAATYRDQLLALRAVREGQRVVAVSDVDQDVIGMHRDGELCEVAIVFVRAGRVVDTLSFPMRKVEVPDEELVGALLSQFYGEEGPAGAAIPDEILVPVLPEGSIGVSDWLAERRGRKVKLIAPQRGSRAHLMQLAQDNAKHAFDEKRRSRDDMADRLADVQAKLRLPSAPRVLECCDISHLGGGDTVGGLVRFTDGEPSKQGYRTYHVRNVSDGDDYAAIYEVLARRFRRGRDAAVKAQAAGTTAEHAAVEDGSSSEQSGLVVEELELELTPEPGQVAEKDDARASLESTQDASRLAHATALDEVAEKDDARASLESTQDASRLAHATAQDEVAEKDDARASLESTQDASRLAHATAQDGLVRATDPEESTEVGHPAPCHDSPEGGGMGNRLRLPVSGADSSGGERGEDPWQFPDLFVIDGGRGQLQAALTAARDLGLHELSIVALAKERETAAGETLTDRVYLPGQKNGIPVRPHTSLVILARARDEAHRFANRAREKLGKGRRFRSTLDDIDGIGEVTRRKLLTAFSGIEAIARASDEELLAVAGVTRRHVAALRRHFGGATGAGDGSGQ